jgi:hypothetical protein
MTHDVRIEFFDHVDMEGARRPGDDEIPELRSPIMRYGIAPGEHVARVSYAGDGKVSTGFVELRFAVSPGRSIQICPRKDKNGDDWHPEVVEFTGPAPPCDPPERHNGSGEPP